MPLEDLLKAAKEVMKNWSKGVKEKLESRILELEKELDFLERSM